jgi:hypothetical protein
MRQGEIQKVEWMNGEKGDEKKLLALYVLGMNKKYEVFSQLSGQKLDIHALVTFLACPRKVTQRRAPGENPLRQARSSSVHFGNLPCGLRTSEMFNPRPLSPG